MKKASLDDAQIRESAYFFWLDDGQPSGRDEEHWLQAIDALTPKRRRNAAARKTTVTTKPATTATSKTIKTKSSALKPVQQDENPPHDG